MFGCFFAGRLVGEAGVAFSPRPVNNKTISPHKNERQFFCGRIKLMFFIILGDRDSFSF